MANSGFFQHWQPREIERQLLAIPRQLRLISFSKLMIGLLVVALLALVIALPLLQQEDSAIRVVFSEMPEAGNAQKPVMLNPRYESVDSRNQPFTIRAKQARQQDIDTVELVKIQADMAMEGGSWMAMQAEQGVLQLKKKRGYLRGDIRMFSDDGYELHTQEAYLNMQDNAAYAQAAIRGQGPMGNIEADSYAISGKDRTLLFQGNVKLVLYP